MTSSFLYGYSYTKRNSANEAWASGIFSVDLFSLYVLNQQFPTLGNPNVLGLQLPDTMGTTTSGEGFWELQSKNTWVIQG